VDEKWGKDLNAVIDNKSYSVGISEDNDLVLTSVEKNLNSTIVNFMVENNEFSVELPITGPKLELNYLLAVGMAYFSNQASMEKIVMNSRLLNNPEGRFENISFNENDIYIDYAHTPEAISEAIDIVKDKYSMVIVVLGAGGNRDSGKRKLMGKASNNADKVIITNDNPRKENPMQIAKDILDGVDLNKDVEIILDRQLAIRKGIELLQGDSALLVLGKGHEKTQELEKGLVDFQDSLVIQEIIKELK
jgi:UDP-N-acetylmuramoyl-L-alanyl-D-glutamate--2,6-diaminopimelate ligase